MNKSLFITISIFLLAITADAQSLKQCFDFNWKFMEKDVAAQQTTFNDKEWKSVDLPHDWDIFHAPSLDAPTGNDGGYYPGGTGWYRKSFKAPKMQEGSVCKLHFEGVYHRCEVYVNGTLAGAHGYGYTPFFIDMTPYINKDKENVVAVRVNNSELPNSRWYSGSGIFRHVWLEVFEKNVADDPSKLFIRTEGVYGISADGNKADSAVVRISYEGRPDECQTFRNVNLWSPSHPALYDVRYGSLSVKHGFRTIVYSADKGFELNGKPILINGACVHHDNGVIGAMAFDEAEIRKVRLMKKAGFNLIRTSHNPQTRAFLDACDSIGMMVIDEVFDGWYTEKTPHDYHEMIDSCYAEDIAAFMLRDRNHPSVVCWSIGNEVMERKELRVVQTAKKFKAAMLAHDTTRPVTEALCSWDSDWEIYDPHADVLDIVGYNYMIHKAESDHQRSPKRVIWQTESFPRDAFRNWKHVTGKSYVIGDVVWTGIDYLGESGIGQFYHEGEPRGEHYLSKHFPFHGAYCGDVDMTGWRKPISHYRDMLYNVEDKSNDFIYMAVREPDLYENGKVTETAWSVWPTWESWNWKGWEGKPVNIEVYTKAHAVALYLNDKLVEKKNVSEGTEYKAVFTLPYEAGVLRAVAIDADGREGASTRLATSGEPYALRLTPERKNVKADGSDLVYLVMEVVDKNGNVVPDAAIAADISVKGAGRFLAAGSASLKDIEPTTSNHVTTYKGRAIVVVRTTKKAGTITVEANSSLKNTSTVVKAK